MSAQLPPQAAAERESGEATGVWPSDFAIAWNGTKKQSTLPSRVFGEPTGGDPASGELLANGERSGCTGSTGFPPRGSAKEARATDVGEGAAGKPKLGCARQLAAGGEATGESMPKPRTCTGELPGGDCIAAAGNAGDLGEPEGPVMRHGEARADKRLIAALWAAAAAACANA
mmetsp:Transcript_13190/g.30992  ORF Transcript_13190/g.30992 Transcript_13190/m.30992 type:complete len:173 (+) Transcript_13190:78-596(+)